MADRYREKLETIIVGKDEEGDKISVEQMWSEFKKVILNTAGEVCGTETKKSIIKIGSRERF